MAKKIVTLASIKSLVITSEVAGEKIPCTTSLKIAEIFGKSHKHVLRNIDNLIKSGQFTESNFGLSEYTDSSGRKLKMHLLDELFTTVVLMGFTGQEAIEWKIAYAKEFQRMRKQISNSYRIIRSKGDEPAFLVGLQTDILKEKLEEIGNPPRNDHYMNSHCAVNELVFGESGKGKQLRKGMSPEQWTKLCQTISATIKVYAKLGYLRKDALKEQIALRLPSSDNPLLN